MDSGMLGFDSESGQTHGCWRLAGLCAADHNDITPRPRKSFGELTPSQVQQGVQLSSSPVEPLVIEDIRKS